MCRETHTHNIYYQCPVHGFFCQKHVVGNIGEYSTFEHYECDSVGLTYSKEDHRCFKTPSKFIWSYKVNRWIEEGVENEEDFIKEKTSSKNKNSEIKVLIELFEKNVINKEQFLDQIKQKIK